MCDRDAEQNSDNERNDDENSPREERGPIIQRASLQKREHEEHEENEERHGDTSFLGNRKSRQRLDRHGTIVVGSCETFHHYNVQGVK